MQCTLCNAMYVMQCNCFPPECLDGCLGGGVDTEAGPGVGSGGGGHLHQPAPALLQQRQHLNSIILILIMISMTGTCLVTVREPMRLVATCWATCPGVCQSNSPHTHTPAVQYSTVQYSTVQYSTVQYSTGTCIVDDCPESPAARGQTLPDGLHRPLHHTGLQHVMSCNVISV